MANDRVEQKPVAPVESTNDGKVAVVVDPDFGPAEVTVSVGGCEPTVVSKDPVRVSPETAALLKQSPAVKVVD